VPFAKSTHSISSKNSPIAEVYSDGNPPPSVLQGRRDGVCLGSHSCSKDIFDAGLAHGVAVGNERIISHSESWGEIYLDYGAFTPIKSRRPRP